MAKPGISKEGSRALGSSAQIFRPGRKRDPRTERTTIALPWQVEAYRHVNICGEARYAVTLFAAMAGRAEIGISEPQGLSRKATWVQGKTAQAEVESLAVLAPTVRERTKLIRDYMTHYTIAGECYLIARARVDTDPGPSDESYIWEIVAVTELRNTGSVWEVRHDNNNWLPLSPDDPIIRLWNPDPNNRREAWSPLRSLMPTLIEIEWLTKHIFTQVKSRLMSAGVWFLPDNMTFPSPPPDAVVGGAEAIAGMNEAERFMVSLAAAGMQELGAEEVSFPSVVMADPAALSAVDQGKLIQFWAEIDDKAMLLRSDAVRRFALGMDLPPEQVLGSSGLAVTGAGGSAGSVNHWGVWANEEQTISAHIEPALDLFTGTLTDAFLREAVPGTEYVIAYDTATLRLRQDRSKEAIELYDRGELKGSVMLRETGFDPENDMMDEEEQRLWMLRRLASGSASPEQLQSALMALGVVLDPVKPLLELPASQAPEAPKETAPALPDRRSSLDDHPYEGPPRVQHDQSPAPYRVVEVSGNALLASCEGLVLRALEKAGNRLLNDGRRGRDRDRDTPPLLAHTLRASGQEMPVGEFDFSTAPLVLAHLPQTHQAAVVAALGVYCSDLYVSGQPYTRESLIEALGV